MPYTPNQWVDGDKSRPLSAARLAHMESQYAAAMADVPGAILQEITEDGPVKDQLNATIDEVVGASIGGPVDAPSDGTVIASVLAANPRTVAVSGHSNFYGQGGDEALPGINGQEGANRRSTNNPPDSLKAALDVMWPGGFTLANNTRSGEDSRGVLGAYANPNLGWTHGDIEFVWLDSNDFVAGIPLDENAENIATLASQIIAAGSFPVFLGNHYIASSTGTFERQARADLVRRVAARFGTRYIDVTELLNGIERPINIWTDGVHYSDAAFAMIGTRLAALFGPKGLDPIKLGPGSQVLPSQNLIMGGTLTTRAGAFADRTVRIDAGQTAVLAFEAGAPCDAIVRFFSNQTVGIGTGRIRYALSKAGVADRRVNIAATNNSQPGIPVRGHGYRGGIDLVFVTCDTGSLEIEGIDFVQPATNMRLGSPTDVRVLASQLAGVALCAPPPGYTYAVASDAHTPFSIIKPDGSDADVRVDMGVTFGAGTGSSSQSIALIASQSRDNTWLGYGCGVAVRRSGGGGELIIRIFNADGSNSNHHVNASYFTPGTAWAGVVSFVFSGGDLQVYLNGVAVGAPITTLPWVHYILGAYSGAGPLLSIQGGTIQAPAGCA